MNVISFSLYGPDPKYVVGMLENVKLAPLIYPGWEVWVYIDEDHPAIEPLQEAGAVVWAMPKSTGHEGMFWRFLAADEPDVERVIFRDADSRLSPREKAAVDEWIKEDTVFHVIRDHEHHAEWPILGGLFGLKGQCVSPTMAEGIAVWSSRTEKLDDMRFLADCIWPVAVTSMTHHSSVPTKHPNAKPFPAHGPSATRFCGEIVEVPVASAA